MTVPAPAALPPALLLSAAGQVLNVAAGYLLLSAQTPEPRGVGSLRHFAHVPPPGAVSASALPVLTTHLDGQLTLLSHHATVMNAGADTRLDCLHVPGPLLDLLRLSPAQLGSLTNPGAATFTHLVTLRVTRGAFSQTYWLRVLRGPHDLAWLTGPLERGDLHLRRPAPDLPAQVLRGHAPIDLDFTSSAWDVQLTITPRHLLPVVPHRSAR